MSIIVGVAIFCLKKLTPFARVCCWICPQSQAAASVSVESWLEKPKIKQYKKNGRIRKTPKQREFYPLTADTLKQSGKLGIHLSDCQTIVNFKNCLRCYLDNDDFYFVNW